MQPQFFSDKTKHFSTLDTLLYKFLRSIGCVSIITKQKLLYFVQFKCGLM